MESAPWRYRVTVRTQGSRVWILVEIWMCVQCGSMFCFSAMGQSTVQVPKPTFLKLWYPYFQGYHSSLSRFLVRTTQHLLTANFQQLLFHITLEVLTAVAMLTSIICVTTPCNLKKVNRMFRSNKTPPSLRSMDKRRKKPAWSLSALLAACVAYSSTLKMKAVCSSEISVDFRRTTLLVSQTITQKWPTVTKVSL
jgi:hypothetical protein